MSDVRRHGRYGHTPNTCDRGYSRAGNWCQHLSQGTASGVGQRVCRDCSQTKPAIAGPPAHPASTHRSPLPVGRPQGPSHHPPGPQRTRARRSGVAFVSPIDVIAWLAWLEIQHNPQRCVDAAHLFEVEIAHTFAQSSGVNRCGLFGQHPSEAATYLNLRPKACGSG